MSIKENIALTRRCFNVEDFRGIREAENPALTMEQTLRKVMAEIFDSDIIMHRPEGDMNYESFVEYNIMLMSAFPDFSCTIEDMVAAGDRVAVRLTMRGTHQGPFRGIPATGKKIEIGGISMARFAGGKVVEGWSFSDTVGMMQQLYLKPFLFYTNTNIPAKMDNYVALPRWKL